MWWVAGGAAIALAGAAAIARQSLEQQRALFETDARIVHRLLSQQVVQHDAILATLALLQPAPDAPGSRSPEQRLPALYPRILSVQRSDALDDRQAESRAAKFPRACLVYAIEPFEDAFLVGFREADAGIGHSQLRLQTELGNAHGDAASRRCVLDGVVSKIGDDLTQCLPLCRDPNRRLGQLCAQHDTALAGERQQVAHDVARDRDNVARRR